MDWSSSQTLLEYSIVKNHEQSNAGYVHAKTAELSIIPHSSIIGWSGGTTGAPRLGQVKDVRVRLVVVLSRRIARK